MDDELREAKKPLRREALHLSPFEQLAQWLRDATDIQAIEPTAMVLATTSKDARPSARTVLLKSLDERGLVFYTHYTSRKSRELIENPNACVVFLWKELNRQVTVEGMVTKTSTEESDAYFASRPRLSQIGAWASEQGKEIPTRAALEQSYASFTARFEGKEVPRPAHWGGWRIIPTRFEFWQEGQHRLHDRFEYRLRDNQWLISRISP